MLRDFIMNVSLLVTSLFIIGQLLQNIRALPNILLSKTCIGVLFGLQGVLMMVFTIHPTPGSIVDMRHLAIVIATIYAGPAAALMSSGIIAIGRILLFDPSYSSLIAALSMLAIGGVCAALSPIRANRYILFFIMNTVSLLVCSTSIVLNTPGWHTSARILSYHWPISFLGGFVILYITHYMYGNYQQRVKLFRSEQQHRQLLVKLPDALIVHSEGAIRFINERGAQMIGARQLQDLVGRAVNDFLHAPMSSFQQSGILPSPGLQEAACSSSRQQLVRLDGSVLDVEVSASAIVYDQHPAVLATFRDMTEYRQTEQRLRAAVERLQQLSAQDGLTGIANRRALDERLEQVWHESFTLSKRISFILFDVDDFKPFNDLYGHQAGDDCLRTIAAAAESIVAGSDRFIARYGGEEFAVVLPDTGKDTAAGIAESIRKKIETLAISHEGSSVAKNVTVSIGVGCALPHAPQTIAELVQMADKALYQAKCEGRNRTVVWK